MLRNFTAALVTCYAEGMNEADQIEVTEHNVPLRNLREPVRIVQVTDLHRSWCVSEAFIERIVRKTNALRPDLALLTGDFVTRSSAFAPSCMRHLADIKATMGKYAVLGNHDYWCDENRGAPVISDALHNAGVEVVINRSLKLDHGLRLVGVDDVRAGKPDLQAAFAEVTPGEPVVAMTHNPGMFFRLARYDCVTLAGHTHGGQINIPILSDKFMGGPFTRGWYSFNEAPGRLYVSRGLGTIHIPIRVRSLPEIAVFNLAPA